MWFFIGTTSRRAIYATHSSTFSGVQQILAPIEERKGHIYICGEHNTKKQVSNATQANYFLLHQHHSLSTSKKGSRNPGKWSTSACANRIFVVSINDNGLCGVVLPALNESLEFGSGCPGHPSHSYTIPGDLISIGGATYALLACGATDAYIASYNTLSSPGSWRSTSIIKVVTSPS